MEQNGRPECLCHEEMSFVANNQRSIVWRCSCGRLMIETGGLQEWYEPGLAGKGEHAQEGAGIRG